jgi:tRNA uridine 5-carboxymethylaminomethyl modification enzyme
MFLYPKEYDVIVVGGGHAGVEAALAASRMGCEVLLLTTNADTIAQMSCNPAIGGLAKGHLVREIDALGGEMGKAADMSGLQFRMLNTKKGPAVWSPRAQCDKKHYQFRMKWICERQSNLDIKQAQCIKLIHRNATVVGVETTIGVKFHGKTVIITTGTFLRGLMHIGRETQLGGRAGESSASGLSASLMELGLELGRFKTGTPPRLLKSTIDFARTEEQLGDDPIPYFTFWKDDLFHVEHGFTNQTEAKRSYPPCSVLERNGGQLSCFITYTTNRTAKIVCENLHLSPLYSGIIEGTGPRYCPSIEDKIVRFPAKERHQIFLEPEGIATDEIYVNGLSTSLPFQVQWELVRTIGGCEKAEIIRPAYAVEYDCVFPTQLKPSLETKVCDNLYLAGQINGTSGYEEAAAQGLIAGINAAKRIKHEPPLVLKRSEAYIGVLIDDLVTKGTVEPYRMFTSRAEYRLSLRQDNADQRLCEIGFRVGLLPVRQYSQFLAKRDCIATELTRLRTTRYGSETLDQLLRRPEVSYANLPLRDETLPREVARQVEVEIKYGGYIERQYSEIAKFKAFEQKQIPFSFDYSTVPNLRLEARQKLSQIRPLTVGQASRISGVSPADISILMVWLKRHANLPTLAESSPSPTEGVCNEEETAN